MLWRVNGYDILYCLDCGLIFADVSESDILNTYEMDYYKNVYPDYQSDKNIHERNNGALLKEIEKYFVPGRMIEVGSAFGFFLDSATKRKWKSVGYEMSQYASEIARTQYHQDVRNADFLTHDSEDKVDLVCMFDTIEHLLRPSLYIEKISKILKKEGGVVITTGDISSFFSKICGQRWRMIAPPIHVYYYSRKTITLLLKKYGFEILSISTESKYQNLNSVLKYVVDIDKKLIPAIPIKINLGDLMLVIAKKS